MGSRFHQRTWSPAVTFTLLQLTPLAGMSLRNVATRSDLVSLFSYHQLVFRPLLSELGSLVRSEGCVLQPESPLSYSVL